MDESLRKELQDSHGLLGKVVWRQVAFHLSEWASASFDPSGRFLAGLSATGYVGVWDVASAWSGYDLLGPDDWPSPTFSSPDLTEAEASAESAALRRIKKDLYGQADRSMAAIRAASKRASIVWGPNSRVLYVAQGHFILAVDVTTSTIIGQAE
jgi:hypothetical protein